VNPATISINVHIAMIGFVPLVAAMFLLFPGRRAVIAAFVGGWLLLPNFVYSFEGFPEYTKISAISLTTLTAALVCDPKHIFAFRPRPADGAALVWVLVPALTAAYNGDSAYDGFSGVLKQILEWGLPYYLGRVYFTDWGAVRDLAVGVLIGAVVYVPLCAWEAKMSPQLHTWVYGYRQHEWIQTKRFGGWRPMVFLQHGLATGAFISLAAVLAIWLWRTRAVRALAGAPMGLIAFMLFLTAIGCKSLLAIALMFLGAGVVLATRALRAPSLIAALLLVPPVYMAARTAGGWDGQELIDAAAMVSADREGSVRVRIESENMLWARARERMLLGWGDKGRSLVLDESGRLIATPDGMWIIAVGKYGLVGLASLTGLLLVGPALLLLRIPAPYWSHPSAAGATGLAVVLVLHMCDNIFNAMFNPIFVLAAGAVVAVAPRRRMRVARPGAGRGPVLEPPVIGA
jgi:hypothetical protein